MSNRSWWQHGEALLVLGVLIAAIATFADAAGRTPLDGDERDPIYTARYFGYVFVDHVFGGRNWVNNYWTHDQLMMVRYVIGFSLWARGYDLNVLPNRDVWGALDRSRTEEWAYYDSLLGAARASSVLLSSAAVVLLFLIGRLLSGPLAGLAAAVLTLGSPLAREHLSEAKPEAALMFFALLALLLAVLGTRSGRTASLPIGWAIALGVALGLAFATKLTALFGLTAAFAWGLSVAALAASGPRQVTLARRLLALLQARGWILAIGVALGVFVLSNPHLYPDPIAHTEHLFQHRAGVMQGQEERYDSIAVPNLMDRLRLVLNASLVNQTATGALGVPLEPLLATIGAVALLLAGWQTWRHSGQAPIEGFVLLTVAAYFVGVSVTLRLAFAQYFVPTLVLGTLLSGIGLASVLRRLAPRSQPKAWGLSGVSRG